MIIPSQDFMQLTCAILSLLARSKEAQPYGVNSIRLSYNLTGSDFVVKSQTNTSPSHIPEDSVKQKTRLNSNNIPILTMKASTVAVLLLQVITAAVAAPAAAPAADPVPAPVGEYLPNGSVH